ncbi:MAG: hypothetical protein HQL41_03890 [Alphaproteobacteria bacterium]|nr:hypothetical protein [Alphaproteobacteria bacterium]
MRKLPPDQQELFDSLAAKLPADGQEDALIHQVDRCLDSLLRRQGDAEFRVTVHGAFLSGLRGATAAERLELAREVLAIVVEKRPEIAAAWALAHRERVRDTPHRRAVDDEEVARAILPPPEEEPPAPALDEAPAPPPYAHAWAEDLVARQLTEILRRKVKVFVMGEPSIPSAAWWHERPLFLFSPRFVTALLAFVEGPLMESCRNVLEHQIYVLMKKRALAHDEARDAFFKEKRPLLWRILTEKLTRLAPLHQNAVATLELARKKEKLPAEFKVVRLPVRVPRRFRVLGVRFSLGSETRYRRVKVPVITALDPDEAEALALFDAFRKAVEAEGLALPDGTDFQFLSCLFDFDAKLFAKTHAEFRALADHPETTPQFLAERLKWVDKQFSNFLSDILLLMLFGDGVRLFDFKALYETCIGASLTRSAQVTKRPFVQDEVRRRPVELAWQMRMALVTGVTLEAASEAANMLVMVHGVMSSRRFAGELRESIEVLEAFKDETVGDPRHGPYAEAMDALIAHLSGKELKRQTCLMHIASAWHALAKGAAS